MGAFIQSRMAFRILFRNREWTWPDCERYLFVSIYQVTDIMRRPFRSTIRCGSCGVTTAYIILPLNGAEICDILSIWESHRAKGGFTPLIFRRVRVALQTKERRVITMVTYADLFQLLLLIVALVGLVYQICKGKR